MRLLAGMKIFQEIEKDTYIARPLATAFAPPSPLAAGILHMWAISDPQFRLLEVINNL